jgi:hypothetical protein
MTTTGTRESRERERRVPGAATWVSIMVCVGYFLIARAVINVFPFSTFSMFSGSRSGKDGEARGCQILAIGGSGAALDVTEFHDWECPPWQDAARRSIDELRCDAHGNVEVHIREYIERASRKNDLAEPVRLVRRLWLFREDEPTETADYPIATCRAVHP